MKINYKIWVPVAIVLIGGLILAKKKGWIGGNSNAIEVEIGYAHKRMVVETVTASGKIQPEVEVKMSPEVSGEIIEVNVVEGQQVKEGDVLIRINPDIYESAITRARAAVNSAKSTLAQSKAGLIEAEKLWKRNQILFESGAIAEQEYDAAQRAISVSELQEEASRYQLQSAEANLDEAYKNLKRTTIIAPIDGTISQLNVELGERVVGTATMTGTEMLRIAKGDTTNIEIDAFLGESFTGVVSEIANSAKLALGGTADQVTNFEVKIRILNTSYEGLVAQYGSHPFRPGMTATVDIITNKVKDALVVPIQAVGVRKDTSEQARMIDEAMTDANEKFEVVFLPEGTKVDLKVVNSGIQDDEFIMVDGIQDSTRIVIGPYSAVSKDLLKGASIKEKK
jgi:HlyD family secretion protein